MNFSWIILLLLLCNQSDCGRSQSDCGCGQSDRGRGQSDCGCEDSGRSSRGSSDQDSCPCEDSRFEPRFEQRPFSGNNSTCGCEGESN